MRAATCALLGVAMVTARVAAASDYSDKEVRQIAARYAACVIQLSPTRARQFVISRMEDAPVFPECVNQAAYFPGSQIRFPGEMYRYGLAEALLVHDYRGGLPGGIEQAASLDRPAPEPLLPASLPHDAKRAALVREKADRRRGFWAMDVMTECVARADPAGTYELVNSPIEGPQESAALMRLKPAISRCVVQGETIRLNRSVLRGALATNLYQMAYSIRPVSGRGA